MGFSRMQRERPIAAVATHAEPAGRSPKRRRTAGPNEAAAPAPAASTVVDLTGSQDAPAIALPSLPPPQPVTDRPAPDPVQQQESAALVKALADELAGITRQLSPTSMALFPMKHGNGMGHPL